MNAILKNLLKPINLLWLVLVAAAIWAVGYLPLAEIWTTLRGLNPLGLVILLVFNFFIVIVLCSRWWWIIRLQGYGLPFLRLAAYRLIGFSVSYFSPGTQFGGEPLQVYFLEKREEVPRADAVASVTLDKLFELLSNFTFLVIGTLLILGRGILIIQIPKSMLTILLAGLLAFPLIYLFLLWSGRHPFTWVATRLPARIQKQDIRSIVQPLVNSAEDQIAILLRTKPASMIGILILSGAIWVLFIAEYWLMWRVLGGTPDFRDAVSGLTAARLSFLTPVPGGLGALEASQVLAASWMGLGPAMGISASLLIRARDITLGLLGFGIGSLLTHSKSTGNLAIPYGEIPTGTLLGGFQDE